MAGAATRQQLLQQLLHHHIWLHGARGLGRLGGLPLSALGDLSGLPMGAGAASLLSAQQGLLWGPLAMTPPLLGLLLR
eukprot:gene3078-6050_t